MLLYNRFEESLLQTTREQKRFADEGSDQEDDPKSKGRQFAVDIR